MRPRRARARTAGLLALALLPLLLLWPALRHTVESRMALHMLGAFPALFAAGWAAAVLCRLPRGGRRWLRVQRRLDWRGWTGATLLSAVALVWMLPSALDASLLVPAVAVAKWAGWWLAGWLLADGWRRLDTELRLFLLGNLAWMMATAGLLYLEAPDRLCVNYLQDDQRHAGIGLVLAALLLVGLALRVASGRAGVPKAGTARASTQGA